MTWLRFANDLFPSQVTVLELEAWAACYIGAIFCRYEVSEIVIIFICPQVHCATVQGDFEHCLRCICCVHGGHKPGKNNLSYKEPVEIFNMFVFRIQRSSLFKGTVLLRML